MARHCLKIIFVSYLLILGIHCSFAKEQTPEQKRALLDVYNAQSSSILCTSGAGDIKGCAPLISNVSNAVKKADQAGVPRDKIIKMELKAVSDAMKTTTPTKNVTPGVAQ